MEVHDGVAAASDTSSEGILDAVVHTSVVADIEVDAVVAADDAEVPAVQEDVVQHTASAWEEAAYMGLGDSCAEAVAEAFARSPKLVTLTWHAKAEAHSSEQSRQDILARSRCDTSAWAVEACSHGVAGGDAYAAEAEAATVPAHSHRSKQAKAIGIPGA